MAKGEGELSLRELAGREIADVYGYVSSELGGEDFKLTRVEFTDGESVFVEGEHDFPYLCETDRLFKLPEEDAQ